MSSKYGPLNDLITKNNSSESQIQNLNYILDKDKKELNINLNINKQKSNTINIKGDITINDENPIDLDMIIQTEGLRNSDGKKSSKENEYDSLSMSISNNANIENDNLLTNTIQDISEIENMNSNMYLVIDEDKL